MNVQHNSHDEDYNRSLVLGSETDYICDYVISENFDVKDYLGDTLNLDCRETFLTVQDMIQIENQPFSISHCNPKKHPLRVSIEETMSKKILRRRVSSSSSTSLSLDSVETSSLCSPNEDNASVSPPLIIDASTLDLSEYRPETMMTSIANIENSTNFNSIPMSCDNNFNHNFASVIDEKPMKSNSNFSFLQSNNEYSTNEFKGMIKDELTSKMFKQNIDIQSDTLKNVGSEDEYLRKQTSGSFLPPPYKDITSIFPSNLVVDTFPLTLVSGQNKSSKSNLGRISSSNILREKNEKTTKYIENISSLPFGASEKKPIIGCINIEDHSACKDSTTSVQKTVNEFISESNNKQRNVEEMSSADQQQKPSAYAYDGPRGRRRRSQRLENRRKESESSGRSVSPSSALASGSEVEIEDFSTIDPIATSSTYKKSENRISDQGTGCSTTAVTIPQKYNYSSAASGVLPGSSQQHLQATRFSQYNRSDKRNKEPWRFGCKRKSTAPLYDSESIGESITIPPPKYTPPVTASEEVAIDSSYPVESRSPKSLKRSSSTSKQHNVRNKIDTDNRKEDTEEDRILLIKVPRDPLHWTFNDITNWLQWAEAQYELEKVQLSLFPSHGRDLCKLSRIGFENLTGSKLSGEKLFKDLSLRRDPSKPISPLSEFSTSSSPAFFEKSASHSLSPSPSYGSTTMVHQRTKSESPASSLSSATHVPTAAHVTSSQQITSNQPQQTTNTTYGFQLRDDQEINEDTYTQFLPSPSPGPASRPSSSSTNSTSSGQIQLWQFLLQLLSDPNGPDNNSRCIVWEHESRTAKASKGEFRLIEPDEVARRWGEKKNKPNMNYDKLSRSLRYYYDKNILAKIPGKRYAYKFDFQALTVACRAQQTPTPSDAKPQELYQHLAPLLGTLGSDSSTSLTQPTKLLKNAQMKASSSEELRAPQNSPSSSSIASIHSVTSPDLGHDSPKGTPPNIRSNDQTQTSLHLIAPPTYPSMTITPSTSFKTTMDDTLSSQTISSEGGHLSLRSHLSSSSAQSSMTLSSLASSDYSSSSFYLSSTSQPPSTTFSTDSGYILPEAAEQQAIEESNVHQNQQQSLQPPSYEISISQIQQTNQRQQSLSMQEQQQSSSKSFSSASQYPQHLPSMTADEVMDFLQNTSQASSDSNTITQLLPMAAPLQPISTSRQIPPFSTNTSSLQLNDHSSTIPIRSSSAPADCMITSPSTTSFLGTFASTPSFQTALQQSQQPFPAGFAGGRPRHHTTTNVLSLEHMESSQEPQNFLADELQHTADKF